jgi:hypothetical protein
LVKPAIQRTPSDPFCNPMDTAAAERVFLGLLSVPSQHHITQEPCIHSEQPSWAKLRLRLIHLASLPTIQNAAFSYHLTVFGMRGLFFFHWYATGNFSIRINCNLSNLG